jgi:type I restriction enzyme S subunit
MTVEIASLVSENLDIWTTAVERKSGAGRGGGKRISLYGVDRLRALILDLAVRGLLVPQNAEEESAAKLIQNLRIEGRQKSSETRNKLPNTQKPVADVDKLFPVPESWEWVQLGEITDLITSGSRDWAKYLSNDGAKFVTMGNLSRGSYELRYEKMHYVQLSDAREGARTSLRPGDLLVSITGDVGNMALIPEGFGEAYINQHTAMIRFVPVLRGRFFPEALRAPFAQKQFNEPQRGVKNSFRLSDVQNIKIPVPPLAEQHRIVAKVDELMALCDALEAESAAAMAAHQALVEALLATLTASTDAADLATNWSRLEAHFDTLFTTEASVDALKQTILELAVRGKLVPQVPTDEPAAVMLKAVKKSGADRGAKQKAHSTIAHADQPFDLPKGWSWERFDNLIEPDFPIAYGVLVPGADQTNGIPFVRIADLSITDPAPLPEKSISADVDAQFPRTRLKGGEILMGVVGSIGKLGVAPASWAGANIARAICRIVPSQLLDRSYVLWLLQSDFMQSSFIGDTRTLAQPTLNIGLIRLAATPVPPVAEQKRIVAKVDELMALCDALKACITDAAVTQKHLADVITEWAAA